MTFPISQATVEARSESVLESRFWHRIRKSSRGPFSRVVPQFRVGQYRCDSMFMIRDRKVVIEVDGSQFHRPDRDDQRDEQILSSGHVDEIIRIPYAAMWHHDRATLHVLGAWHDEFQCQQSLFEFNEVELIDEQNKIARGIRECGHSSGFKSFNEWLEWSNRSMSVWRVTGNIGYAESPKAYFCQHNTRPITRQLADGPRTKFKEKISEPPDFD